MKITLTDKLHISIGLNVFLGVWFVLEEIDPTINGIWFGFLAVNAVAWFKEANDKWGWIPFLLTDGKTKTGMNGRDIMFTVALPLLIIAIVYAIRG